MCTYILILNVIGVSVEVQVPVKFIRSERRNLHGYSILLTEMLAGIGIQIQIQTIVIPEQFLHGNVKVKIASHCLNQVHCYPNLAV